MRPLGMAAWGGLMILTGCSQPDAFTLYNNTGLDVRLVVETAAGAGAATREDEIILPTGKSKELREGLQEWSVAPRVAVKAVFGGCTYTYSPEALAEGLRRYTGEPGTEISIRLEADGRILKLSPRAVADANGRLRGLRSRAETAQTVDPVQAEGFPMDPLERVCV